MLSFLGDKMGSAAESGRGWGEASVAEAPVFAELGAEGRVGSRCTRLPPKLSPLPTPRASYSFHWSLGPGSPMQRSEGRSEVGGQREGLSWKARPGWPQKVLPGPPLDFPLQYQPCPQGQGNLSE